MTTYTAMSQHAREWHRRIGGGVDVQTFATFWASLPAEHRAVTPPAPEGELCPHCKKPVRLMRKVVWRGDNEARSRIKKDGKNLWDKQCDGPCNDKARAIILRSWIEAGHEFVELEDASAAAPRKPAAPRGAQEEAGPGAGARAAAGRGRPRRVHAARGREGGGEAGRESAAAVPAEGAAGDAGRAQGLVPGADAAGGARRRRRQRAAPAADGVRVERVVREGGAGALDAGPRRSMCWSTRRWEVDVFPEALCGRPGHRPVLPGRT